MDIATSANKKINIDGASKGNPGLASAGYVMIDHHGEWLRGPTSNIGINTSISAKLWGIYLGLKLAWDRGF